MNGHFYLVLVKKSKLHKFINAGYQLKQNLKCVFNLYFFLFIFYIYIYIYIFFFKLFQKGDHSCWIIVIQANLQSYPSKERWNQRMLSVYMFRIVTYPYTINPCDFIISEV